MVYELGETNYKYKGLVCMKQRVLHHAMVMLESSLKDVGAILQAHYNRLKAVSR